METSNLEYAFNNYSEETYDTFLIFEKFNSSPFTAKQIASKNQKI